MFPSCSQTLSYVLFPLCPALSTLSPIVNWSLNAAAGGINCLFFFFSNKRPLSMGFAAWVFILPMVWVTSTNSNSWAEKEPSGGADGAACSTSPYLTCQSLSECMWRWPGSSCHVAHQQVPRADPVTIRKRQCWVTRHLAGLADVSSPVQDTFSAWPVAPGWWQLR